MTVLTIGLFITYEEVIVLILNAESFVHFGTDLGHGIICVFSVASLGLPLVIKQDASPVISLLFHRPKKL